MNEQLEFFSAVEFLPDAEIENAVIDAALHHVENQFVLRQLLDGRPWPEVFGMGGCSHPVSWMGDSRGIEIYFATDKARIIKPAQILARAKMYSPKSQKPINPNPF